MVQVFNNIYTNQIISGLQFVIIGGKMYALLTWNYEWYLWNTEAIKLTLCLRYENTVSCNVVNFFYYLQLNLESSSYMHLFTTQKNKMASKPNNVQ